MRVLLVSDLHANAAALAVLPEADAILCGGDLVDYGPDPRAAIAWCRIRCAAVVHGNHDRALAYDEPDGVGAQMREASAATRAIHRTLIDDTELAYLRDLPRLAVVRLGSVTFALTHGVVDDPRRYATLRDAATSVRDAVPDAQVIVVGHTHEQGTAPLGRAVAVNPGSVGLGTTGGVAHHALWEDGRVTLGASRYDVAATLAALDALPLPNAPRATLRDALVHGRRTSRP